MTASRVDLHLHTTYSDGTLTPEELVAAAARRGVALIAVTDHDEVAGVPIAKAAGRAHGIEVLSGVEINTEVGRSDVHILGYGFPATSPALAETLRALRQARLERAARMLNRLVGLGCPLDFDRVLQIAGHGSIGRAHVARALAEAGYVAAYEEAFTRFIGRDRPAYVRRAAFAPEQAIALIHRAGGIASLAHPGKLADPPAMVRRLLAAGLDALEVYHRDHTPAITRRMRRLADKHRLAATGGTDSHGPLGSPPTPIGDVPVPDAVGEEITALLCARGRAAVGGSGAR